MSSNANKKSFPDKNKAFLRQKQSFFYRYNILGILLYSKDVLICYNKIQYFYCSIKTRQANLPNILFMVISTAIFYNDPLYIRLLKAINKIAIEAGDNKLNDTLLSLLAGLCAGLKPIQIAKELGKDNSGYLRGQLCKKIYKYIKILVGKEEEKANWKQIYQWLSEWLQQAQRKINSLNFHLKDISSTPSVTAEKFINPAQEELLRTAKTGLLSSDIADLDQKIDDADKLYKDKKYDEALDKYQSVVAKAFAHYPAEDRFMGVLVKAVSCYNKIEAYLDVEELGEFALEYIKDKKGRADIYNYMAGAWHELYVRSSNSQHLRNARIRYREAKKEAKHDCVLLWNIFDLYIEAHNRENKRIDHATSMKLAWKVFLHDKQGPSSNFEEYKDKILQDRDRILQENPNNQWLLDNLQQI